MPFTYLIGWKNLNKYYYGVRYADNSTPSDLWTVYFSSSDIVTDYRKKLSEAAKKRKLSDEHKAALNAGRRGSKNTPEHQAAVIAARFGKKHTTETRKKISEIKRKRSDLSQVASTAGKESARKRKEMGYYNTTIHSENVKRGWEKRRMRQGGMV